MKGNIFAEMVYRGRRKPEPVDIGESAFRSDFRLILKEEEQQVYQRLKEYEAIPKVVTILPTTAPLPPLWKVLLSSAITSSLS